MGKFKSFFLGVLVGVILVLGYNFLSMKLGFGGRGDFPNGRGRRNFGSGSMMNGNGFGSGRRALGSGNMMSGGIYSGQESKKRGGLGSGSDLSGSNQTGTVGNE